MGTVRLALDEQDAKLVAWKTILPEKLGSASVDSLLARFEHEAHAQQQVQSGYVVGLRAFGALQERGGQRRLPFICSEFVKGRSLEERLGWTDEITQSKWRYLPQIEATRIAIEICRGLKAIHACETNGAALVHRDIKPGNIILEGMRAERPRIVDFGLAWSEEIKDLKLSDTAFLPPGTPPYLDPERIKHNDDPEYKKPYNDIFSLGCILYEMLVGERAFPQATLPEVITAVVQRDPENPRNRAGGIDWELSELTMEMLRKSGKDRPTCEQIESRLLAVLKRFPKDSLERSRHWPRLHKSKRLAINKLMCQMMNIAPLLTGQANVTCGLSARLQLSATTNEEIMRARLRLLELEWQIRMNFSLGECRRSLESIIETINQNTAVFQKFGLNFPNLSITVKTLVRLVNELGNIVKLMQGATSREKDDVRARDEIWRRVRAALDMWIWELEHKAYLGYYLAWDRLLVEIACS